MNKQKKLAKQNTPLYKRVPTLNLVDYSDIKVPLVVIYDSPKDFPGKVVARVWDGEKNRPTNVYCEYENLKRCEDDVMSAGFQTVETSVLVTEIGRASCRERV